MVVTVEGAGSCGCFHDADQLTNPAKGEGCGVGIVTGADDDACVGTLGIPRQPDEVEPVQCENGAARWQTTEPDRPGFFDSPVPLRKR